MKVYGHYTDHGPSGPCGQSVSVTAPWNRLLVWEGDGEEPYDDAHAYMTFLLGRNEHAGRRHPRVEALWREDDHVYAGPIVPAEERV